jgi:hypothetical protein
MRAPAGTGGVQAVEVGVHGAQRAVAVHAAQPGDQPSRIGGLKVAAQRDHVLGRIHPGRDDRAADGDRLGRPDDVPQRVQGRQLPTDDPDRRVAEVLQHGSVVEVAAAGAHVQGHADGAQVAHVKLCHLPAPSVRVLRGDANS